MHGRKLIKSMLAVSSSVILVGGYFAEPIIATNNIEQRRQSKAELQNRRKELAKQLSSAKGEVNEEEKRKKNVRKNTKILRYSSQTVLIRRAAKRIFVR